MFKVTFWCVMNLTKEPRGCSSIKTSEMKRCLQFQVNHTLNIIQIAVIQRIIARLTREICFSGLFDKICTEEITIIFNNNCY